MSALALWLAVVLIVMALVAVSLYPWASLTLAFGGLFFAAIGVSE